MHTIYRCSIKIHLNYLNYLDYYSDHLNYLKYSISIMSLMSIILCLCLESLTIEPKSSEILIATILQMSHCTSCKTCKTCYRATYHESYVRPMVQGQTNCYCIYICLLIMLTITEMMSLMLSLPLMENKQNVRHIFGFYFTFFLINNGCRWSTKQRHNVDTHSNFSIFKLHDSFYLYTIIHS